MQTYPLISLVLLIKNEERGLERALRSVLTLDYPNYELVVQNGDASEENLNILRRFYDRLGNRMRFDSDLNCSDEQALVLALKRCRGDLVGFCPADNELMPQSCKWALEQFSKNSECAVIYGDSYGTDIEGNIITELPHSEGFDLVKFVCHEINPASSATFFRRTNLDAIGLQEHAWTLPAGQFELMLRLAKRFTIQYCPGFISKVNIHKKIKSITSESFAKIIEARKSLLEAFFSDPTLPASIKALSGTALAGMHLWMACNLLNTRSLNQARQQIELALKQQPLLNSKRVKEVTQHFVNTWQKSVKEIELQ